MIPVRRSTSSRVSASAAPSLNPVPHKSSGNVRKVDALVEGVTWLKN